LAKAAMMPARSGMGHFEGRHLLQMVVQQPGMVDQAEQDQRLPAGNRAALAAHDRARRELGARCLVGPGAEPGGAGYPPFPRTSSGEAAGRTTSIA
jgi:hypothetical protein